MRTSAEQIADLVHRITGFEKLLVALKFSAEADPVFKEKSKSIIPQVEALLSANRVLLCRLDERPQA